MIYYFVPPDGYEVDFYLPEKKQLVQVVQNMQNPSTRERELRALSDAASTISVQSALILTDTNEEDIIHNGLPVQIRSVAEWLIS